MAHVGLAEILYERGELDAALRHVTDGIALCRQLAYAPPLATGLVTLAWIRQAQGDQAGALDAIDQAEGTMPGPDMVDLLNPVPVRRARLLLTQGNTAAAARWTRRRGLGADDRPDYPRERAWLLLARVRLAEQTPGLALRLLGQLRDLAIAQERMGSLVEVQVLRALALAATGDENGALAALTEALSLAAPEGYLRVFVDEGPPMARLLGRLATTPAKAQALADARAPRAHLGRLLEAFERDGLAVLPRPRPGGGAVPGLAAPLSARELQELALLAAGKPNQAIAEELVISLDTVKRHVSHILEKLGVANRTQAVSRARALGLLR